FDSLVGRFYPIVRGLACRMLGSREAAEDATQEIFLKAWRSLPRFRGASRFTTWLHAIAVNHCLNVARQRAIEASRTQPMTERNTWRTATRAGRSGVGRLGRPYSWRMPRGGEVSRWSPISPRAPS